MVGVGVRCDEPTLALRAFPRNVVATSVKSVPLVGPTADVVEMSSALSNAIAPSPRAQRSIRALPANTDRNQFLLGADSSCMPVGSSSQMPASPPVAIRKRVSNGGKPVCVV